MFDGELKKLHIFSLPSSTRIGSSAAGPQRWVVASQSALWARRVYRERAETVIKPLRQQPCLDCKGTFPPECMEFDHARGVKFRNVSSMLIHSLEKLLAEIAKCDIVCANCHAIRTSARRQARIPNSHMSG